MEPPTAAIPYRISCCPVYYQGSDNAVAASVQRLKINYTTPTIRGGRRRGGGVTAYTQICLIIHRAAPSGLLTHSFVYLQCPPNRRGIITT